MCSYLTKVSYVKQLVTSIYFDLELCTKHEVGNGICFTFPLILQLCVTQFSFEFILEQTFQYIIVILCMTQEIQNSIKLCAYLFILTNLVKTLPWSTIMFETKHLYSNHGILLHINLSYYLTSNNYKWVNPRTMGYKWQCHHSLNHMPLTFQTEI